MINVLKDQDLTLRAAQKSNIPILCFECFSDTDITETLRQLLLGTGFSQNEWGKLKEEKGTIYYGLASGRIGHYYENLENIESNKRRLIENKTVKKVWMS